MVPEADSDVPEKAPWEDARLESEPSKPKAKAGNESRVESLELASLMAGNRER